MKMHVVVRSLATLLCALAMARPVAAQKLDVETNVDQNAGLFIINNTSAASSAVYGQVNSTDSGAAGVFGQAVGTGGMGGLFVAGLFNSNTATGVALKASNYGFGNAFVATTYQNFGNPAAIIQANGTNADALRTIASGNGDALVAISQGTGAPLRVIENCTGSLGCPFTQVAVFESQNSNVARIDATGKGFFNGGTQTGGADVAEQVGVAGAVAAYEPGDVLEISPDVDRHVRKTSEAYSTRVVGVYATKPGVLLSDLSIDADASSRVPLGILGILPTKVSAENGAIRRGDLLVAASTPGHAMRAGAQAPVGSIIGKALAAFDGSAVGLIEVLVSVR